MKYQFQFAGIDFNQPSSPRRKWLRTSLLALAFVLAVLAGWQYLRHLMPAAASPIQNVQSVTAAVSAIPSIVAAKPAESPAQLPVALKHAADAGVTALFTRLVEAVKIPTAPATATPAENASANPVSANPAPALPETIKVPATPVATVAVVSQPVLHRPLLVHTPEQLLQRAAQTALGNMLDQANKYPDAYGFGPTDVFEEAKLGAAIPVYTIAEADRASYKSGQPVKPLLKPANQWVFPVMLGDRICCMIQVQYTGHEYVPGNGSKMLAMAWTKIMDKWPAEQGYHPQLVVNPQVPGYFFTIPELPSPNVTDTEQMFFYNPDVSPADVILASWR